MTKRIESDSFGTREIDDDKLWGAMTQRSLENFHIGTEVMPMEIISAYGIIKLAIANLALGRGDIDTTIHGAITEAAQEVSLGKLNHHFPLMVWQTGSGTQTNMNINEVISNRANQILGHAIGQKSPVHPNDHVNLYQSTNDSFPTAMHIATIKSCQQHLIPALDSLATRLQEKVDQFSGIVKIGRTHCQDATPMYLSQEFSGYVSQILSCKHRVLDALEGLYFLAQGGTAVGTGINTYLGFGDEFAQEISNITKLPFKSAPNKFEALATHDAITHLSGALNTLASSCHKIANDIRLLGSGPRCGIGELVLPMNEPGSSIMPGKVNPTQCEALTMVCAQVIGNHMTITFANSNGNLELNVYKPAIAHCILQSVRLLGDACASFSDHCIKNLEADVDRIDFLMNQSLMLVTALSPHIGYDNSAKIAKKAYVERKTLKQAAVESGLINSEDFDRLVIPENMINPS